LNSNNGQVIQEKKSISKKGIIAIIIVALILIAGIALAVYYTNNNYVFKVNGEKVYVKEFEMYLEQQKQGMEQEFGSAEVWNNPIDGVPAIEHAKNTVKETLIDQKVRLQLAEDVGIKLTGEDKRGIDQMFSSGYFTAYLKESGMTEAEYRKLWEEYLIMNKLDEYVESTIQLSNEEIEKVITENPAKTYNYNVRHILFSTFKDASNTIPMSDEEVKAVQQEANEVLARINAGEDFATLAKEYSDDPGSRDNGGLYENIHEGEFVTEFNLVMTQMLQPGEVMSIPIKTEYGYHIIKLESKTQFNETEMAELRNQVADELRHEKAHESTLIQDELAKVEVVMNEKIYNDIK